MKKIPIFILFSMLLWACTEKKTAQEVKDYYSHGDTVIVPPNSKLWYKLKIEPVTSETYKQELVSSGTVKAIPNFYAEIAPPFSGRVTKVHMRLGMKLKPGTPLFEMVCPSFIDAQKVYFQTKSELQWTQSALKRQQDLKANGVGAQRDLEEAQSNFEVKEKEYQNAIASLKIFGVDVNDLVLGQPLVITSPIAGEVLVNEIVTGFFLNSNDPPQAKVADLNKVWVVGMVKEKDLGIIDELGEAEVLIAAYPKRKIIGKIFHINEIVDVDTRSVLVLIECPNQDHILKPGMYVTVNFKSKAQETSFVSSKAVLQFNDKSFVFLQIGKNTFLKRNVETGPIDKDNIAIRSGLEPGDSIINQGAFYLLEAK